MLYPVGLLRCIRSGMEPRPYGFTLTLNTLPAGVYAAGEVVVIGLELTDERIK